MDKWQVRWLTQDGQEDCIVVWAKTIGAALEQAKETIPETGAIVGLEMQDPDENLPRD